MIGKELVGEKPVPIAVVKKILEERVGGEMIYEQKIALEHSQKFAKLKPKDAEKIVEEIKELGLRLRDDVIVKIADIMPEDEVAVKAVAMQSGTQLKKEQIQKILDITSKYKA